MVCLARRGGEIGAGDSDMWFYYYKCLRVQSVGR